MSIIDEVSKVREGMYILNPIASLGMTVPAKIFVSDQIFSTLEYDVWAQIAKACSLEGVNEVAITPDTHVGAGVPIGCVAASETHLYPEAAGYDISCGLAFLETDIHISKLADKSSRRKLIEDIEKRVPSGVGSHRSEFQRKINSGMTQDILRYGAQVLENVKSVGNYHERTHLPIEKDFNIPDKAADKLSQLGSLGGGNHFQEIQVGSDGLICAMIHTGSRGFGWQIADEFFKMTPKSQMTILKYDSEEGQRYWNLHNMAANFAIANRVLILDAIIAALQEQFPDANYKRVYEISHNIIQKEFGRFIHRKGATRAFTGELMKGTEFEKTGHPIIIPGSMAEGAAILYASPNAKESMYSINHGSGRVMSRGAAKRKLDQKEANDWMDNIVQEFDGVKVESILINSRDVPIDESRMCYKDLDTVLQSVEMSGLATVNKRIWPIATVKGNE